MPRYRMLETVDWDRLNGQRVTVEKSSSYVILVTKEGELVKIGVAMRAKPTKAEPERCSPERPSRNGADVQYEVVEYRPALPVEGDVPVEDG
jgi:hypothetical protein